MIVRPKQLNKEMKAMPVEHQSYLRSLQVEEHTEVKEQIGIMNLIRSGQNDVQLLQ